MDPTTALESLRAEVADLRAKQADLEVRLEALTAGPTRGAPAAASRGSGPIAAITGDGATEPSGALTGRRDLIKRAGAAAAGAAAAGAAMTLGDPSLAAAEDLDNLLIGATNTGTDSSTVLNVTDVNTARSLFVVQEGASLAPPSFPWKAVVAGWATTNMVAGALGYNDGIDSEATGVRYGGVMVSTKGTGLFVAGLKNAMRIINQGTAPPTRNEKHSRGDLVVDEHGVMWYCTAGGTPGTWRRLSGAGDTAAGSLTLLASTTRCYDSRSLSPPAGGVKGQIANGTTRPVDTKNNGTGVPDGATAALVNLTVTNTSAAGFLALFKGGIAWPGTSSINWDHAGQSIANLAVVALDASAGLAAYCALGAACDFIIDVIGYYQ
jgi:hypothetical protein